MKPIHEALRELKLFISTLDLFNLLYSTTFFFLFCLFLLTLVNLHWGFAFLPTTIYLVILAYRQTKNNPYLRTEKTTPALHEKLRTAVDNIDKENEIVELLHQEVVRDLKKVETAKFIDFHELSIKTVLLLTVSFLIIVVSYLNVGLDLPDFARKAQAPLTQLKERIAGQDVPNIDRNVPDGNLTSVLGNKSLALLGKREIILQLNPLQSEVNLEDIKDAEEKDFNPPAYPKEIYTSYDAASAEQQPKQNAKVIKTYFQQLSK
ncbi:MAG: hypothetical protein WC595_01205 [Candidatus Nanoarchaeia archaeon]